MLQKQIDAWAIPRFIEYAETILGEELNPITVDDFIVIKNRIKEKGWMVVMGYELPELDSGYDNLIFKGVMKTRIFPKKIKEVGND